MPNYQIFIFLILALFFNNFWDDLFGVKKEKQKFNMDMEQCPVYFSSDINLNQYKLTYGPKRVGSEDDLSGLTYNPISKTLFAVENGESTIFELDLKGNIIREIKTRGFDDVEGITFCGKDYYVVAEERSGRLCKIKISEATTDISYYDAEIIEVDNTAEKNKGLEGVCYDPLQKRFFTVKEKQLPQVYRVVVNQNSTNVDIMWNSIQVGLDLKDFSGMCYISPVEHILICSHESKCIVEVDMNGKQISKLLLQKKHAGLKEDVPQVEGIAIDEQGNLYVCSEPNLFYVFSPKGEK